MENDRSHLGQDGRPRSIRRGNRLRDLRRASGLSRTTLAAALGVTPALLQGWEKGTTPVPEDRQAEFSERFGLSVDYVMGWVE